MIPTYINAPIPEPPKEPIVRYVELCDNFDPKPFYCELSDDLGKSKSQPPQTSTYTSVSFSGTASGVSTSIFPLQYMVKSEK